MNYHICSASWLVQYIRWVLHVVPIMLYLSAYFELLLFSLVGIVVCGCSQTVYFKPKRAIISLISHQPSISSLYCKLNNNTVCEILKFSLSLNSTFVDNTTKNIIALGSFSLYSNFSGVVYDTLA